MSGLVLVPASPLSPTLMQVKFEFDGLRNSTEFFRELKDAFHFYEVSLKND